VLDFVIVAFVIFMVIRAMSKMKKQEEAAPPPPPEPSAEVKLLTEIRDAIKTA
jgi:large conductance mechanosensitive channel